MALVLDPILAAAQDGASRRPVVELLSSDAVSAIPFSGMALTGKKENVETSPTFLALADGRLAGVYRSGGGDVVYTVSDLERTQFTQSVHTPDPLHDIAGLTAAELSGGGLGVVCLVGHADSLEYLLLSVDGQETGSGQIESFAGTLTGLHALALSGGTYLLAVGRLDGGAYSVELRSSADFASWSAAAAVPFSGFDSSRVLEDPFLQEDGPDWLLWVSYADTVTDEGKDVTNLYYVRSSDGGASWSDPVRVTDYQTAATVADHPAVVQQDAANAILVYTEVTTALHLSQGALGTANFESPVDLVFDSVNRKLYVLNAYCSSGDKVLANVVKVDVDSWTVEDIWDETTVPAFSTLYTTKHVWWNRARGAGSYVVMSVMDDGHYCFAILDGQADSIRHINFVDLPTYGLVANVTGWTFQATSGKVAFVQVDEVARRIYVCFMDDYLYSIGLELGYIGLDDPGPTFEYTPIFTKTISGWQGQEEIYQLASNGDMLIVPEEDMVVFSSSTEVDWWKGQMVAYSLSDGSLLHSYHHAQDDQFPWPGLRCLAYHNGYIYGAFNYRATDGQDTKRGLARVDLGTREVRYFRPTYATLDEYGIERIMPVGDELICATTMGIAKFDTVSQGWELIDSTSLPGLTPDGSDNFWQLAYDASTERIFAGAKPGGWIGVASLALDGQRIERATYADLDLVDGVWGAGTALPLVRTTRGFEASPVLNPADGGLMAFWTEDKGGGQSQIEWGQSASQMDLAGLLAEGHDLVLTRSIDGSPARLDFAVASGHLFDVSNTLSILGWCLAKGRLLTLRFGETVGGGDYWQDQGQFLVSEVSLVLERGRYPVARVTAYDRSALWPEQVVMATDFMEVAPEVVLEEVLTTHLDDVTAADCNFPVFDGGFSVEAQWVETELAEIVSQVCSRWGYYPRVDAAGKFSARKIGLDADPDHVYTAETAALVNYGPDDSFSDWTNRVVVHGQELDWTEVLYAEERIKTMAGTVGWWGYKNDFDIYYSEDKSRQARNPRLEIHESATSILFKLAGRIKESIVQVDPEERYCTVEVSAPNLIPVLLAAITGYASASLIPDGLNLPTTTVPVGRVVEQVSLVIALMVLGSTGNYQYSVYAQPVGKVRRSVQGRADDLELQAQIGTVVEKTLEGWGCYTVAHCKEVAEFELAVARMQRRRVKFEKVAHLADEDGDVLEVPHPYSGVPIKVLVTDLRRTYRPGDKGKFVDQIEGWRL